MKVVRAADHRAMPWKNGGGTTVEIMIAPEGASLGDFDWRLSMATVAADGPFSDFPGIDRTLALLEGEGLELGIAGRPAATLTGASPPLAFPGDVPVAARLLGGPIRDLNMMSRRDRCRHVMRRLRLSDAGERIVVRGEALLFCVEGSIVLDDGSSGPVLIARHDSARLETGTVTARAADGAQALAFLVEILRAT